MAADHVPPRWLEEGWRHAWLPYVQMQTAPMPMPVVATEGSRIVLVDGRCEWAPDNDSHFMEEQYLENARERRIWPGSRPAPIVTPAAEEALRYYQCLAQFPGEVRLSRRNTVDHEELRWWEAIGTSGGGRRLSLY